MSASTPNGNLCACRSIACSLTLLACLLCLSAAAAEPLDFKGSRFGEPPPPPKINARPLTLMFTGDSKLCGRTEQQIARHGSEYPFALVADELQSADICFGNCETAITDYARVTPGKSAGAIAAGKAFAFKSSPSFSGEIFADSGFDILQLANNHAMDYCAEGLLDTMDCLDSAGIAHVGGGADYASAIAPRIVEADGGVKVGFISASLIVPLHSAAGSSSPGIATLPRDYAPFFERQVAKLRKEGCALVVFAVHWGVESTTVPNEQQRRVGRAAIDAGADLVIGSHTHSMQGIEFYGEGLIAYSLGNFVFTGASRKLAGGILRITAEPDADGGLHIAEAALLPCWINDGRPTPSNDSRLLSQLATIMKATGSSLSSGNEGWLSLQPER